MFGESLRGHFNGNKLAVIRNGSTKLTVCTYIETKLWPIELNNPFGKDWILLLERSLKGKSPLISIYLTCLKNPPHKGTTFFRFKWEVIIMRAIRCKKDSQRSDIKPSGTYIYHLLMINRKKRVTQSYIQTQPKLNSNSTQLLTWSQAYLAADQFNLTFQRQSVKPNGPRAQT